MLHETASFIFSFQFFSIQARPPSPTANLVRHTAIQPYYLTIDVTTLGEENHSHPHLLVTLPALPAGTSWPLSQTFSCGMWVLLRSSLYFMVISLGK